MCHDFNLTWFCVTRHARLNKKSEASLLKWLGVVEKPICSRFLNRIHLILIDSSPDHTTGIFEGVPKDGGIVEGEFEICDRPHLPTYNLPVMQNDELTSGYVCNSLLGILKIEPLVKLL